MGRRALVGTAEGYQPCQTCRHARLRHIEHGTGRCSVSHPIRTQRADGTAQLGLSVCPCPAFTTDERTT